MCAQILNEHLPQAGSVLGTIDAKGEMVRSLPRAHSDGQGTALSAS